ncbi:MAG: endonuclease/exonuclease/phosphatase family protein [Thermodesulfobacteriota bacterium]
MSSAPSQPLRPASLIVLIILLLAPGCTDVPDQPAVAGNRATPQLNHCPATTFQQLNQAPPAPMAQLDPASFQIVTWNIYKGLKKNWQADLQRYADQSDILILQEGYLSPAMHQFLEENLYYWHMANAFRFRNTICGVITASKVSPLAQCAMRQQEPLLRLPKTTMVTSYALAGHGESLLVINLHMVNFTLGQRAFRSQLAAVGSLMVDHEGPVILAGDLNTWNSKRLAIIHQFSQRHDLQEVEFARDQRSTRFGQILDHVWYRGLVPSGAHIEDVSSSDHNPCLVTFRVAQ